MDAIADWSNARSNERMGLLEIHVPDKIVEKATKTPCAHGKQDYFQNSHKYFLSGMSTTPDLAQLRGVGTR